MIIRDQRRRDVYKICIRTSMMATAKGLRDASRAARSASISVQLWLAYVCGRLRPALLFVPTLYACLRYHQRDRPSVCSGTLSVPVPIVKDIMQCNPQALGVLPSTVWVHQLLCRQWGLHYHVMHLSCARHSRRKQYY